MEDGDNRLFRMYVGTYAAKDEESIFLFYLFPDTGRMKLVKGFKAGESPSYIAADRQTQRLFAVNEVEEFDGKETGAVRAFTIDQASGFLNFRNKVSSEGSLPVSVNFLDDVQKAIVANYNSGSIAVFTVEPGGKLSEASGVVQHHGSGQDEERQASAHAHQIVVSPDGKFIFVVDLGMDQIRSYQMKSGTLAVSPNSVAYTTTAGWGPRQLVFHPGGSYAYLVHELESMVSALKYEAAEGVFSEIQSLPCIPDDYKKQNKCGGVKVTPDGRFLYVSNRGHNSVAVFAIDEETGQMESVEFKDTEGNWPREFCLSPNGSLLVAANQKSGTLTSFRIDRQTGKLQYTGEKAEVIKPVFVMILEWAEEATD